MDNLHVIVGGSKATIGHGSMEGHGDTFYCNDEGPKTGEVTWSNGDNGDIIFAYPGGEPGHGDYDTYEIEWWAEEIQ